MKWPHKNILCQLYASEAVRQFQVEIFSILFGIEFHCKPNQTKPNQKPITIYTMTNSTENQLANETNG